jgi:hypothetical protein
MLRPRSGARALGAGPRKQGRRIGREPLSGDYPPLQRVPVIGCRGGSVARRDHVHELASNLDHPARRASAEIGLHPPAGQGKALDLV